ncbi:hypothetical protein C8F04DRAFT_1197451 [Mycena alexandri]|uniref:Uncharacterized protein n=1 Tax=Mycena alexandri TaxID=1745969 RepID=A0AAD6S2F1_9AGAR|nr:hypothetical protein C8F04DRAFT_1197451 [Mycena alexandri]
MSKSTKPTRGKRGSYRGVCHHPRYMKAIGLDPDTPPPHDPWPAFLKEQKEAKRAARKAARAGKRDEPPPPKVWDSPGWGPAPAWDASVPWDGPGWGLPPSSNTNGRDVVDST